MYKITKQRYTQEFKQGAVRQVESEGKSPAQVAREFGIAEQTLSKAQGRFRPLRPVGVSTTLHGASS